MPFRSRYIVALLLLLLQVPGGVSGTPTPNRNCPTTTRANRNHVFGRPISSLATTPAPRRAPGFAPARLVQLRGGELHHPETLDDVEAIISKAASEQKLVVIDFTASWYVVVLRSGLFRLVALPNGHSHHLFALSTHIGFPVSPLTVEGVAHVRPLHLW